MVSELSDTDNLLDSTKRENVGNKIDEILYFMDMIGLDETEDFRTVEGIKKVMNSFTTNFDDEKLKGITEKRNKAKMGCAVGAVICVLFVSLLEKIFHSEVLNNLVFWPAGFIVYRYFNKNKSKLNEESGISEIHNNINSIVSDFSRIEVEPNEINLKLLGL